ncbi:aminopeptidase N C-terminal domain-containing protein [Burkholderia cenocepacia]|nr:aminopeptidase N C-terminal domain-containing protein [Burkholderia cenocepacia]MCO8333952.1 aminopeptidase N C-terminal domain-containing protein [Burkholderia cenocepacia]MCO8338910.1 aminopeptidase N C-terminal domain-containing protein [Burkholderia cenocepacia]MCO8346196.1 aminopeptidase N C-terminal domain-containing protein [Burkholderia cenocepacia]MCO8361937.1 aminopeptidase N C-terminal domain-containing protein [Burkholderia cenocepacia]
MERRNSQGERYFCGNDELAFLLAHDGDPFNRWEAGQRSKPAMRSTRNCSQGTMLPVPKRCTSKTSSSKWLVQATSARSTELVTLTRLELDRLR